MILFITTRTAVYSSIHKNLRAKPSWCCCCCHWRATCAIHFELFTWSPTLNDYGWMGLSGPPGQQMTEWTLFVFFFVKQPLLLLLYHKYHYTTQKTHIYKYESDLTSSNDASMKRANTTFFTQRSIHWRWITVKWKVKSEVRYIYITGVQAGCFRWRFNRTLKRTPRQQIIK